MNKSDYLELFRIEYCCVSGRYQDYRILVRDFNSYQDKKAIFQNLYSKPYIQKAQFIQLVLVFEYMRQKLI